MRIALSCAIALLAAGCSDKPSEEERKAAVAEVEANQVPPPEGFGPQVIGYPDIEKNKLYGAGCSFVPQGGGLGAIVLAMADDGYMKRDGELLRFAADKGSAELPYLAHRKYDGRAYSFTLDLVDGSEKRSGEETSTYAADFAVTDSRGREVYRSAGTAQCGA